jgi:glutamate carboxypeptidase
MPAAEHPLLAQLRRVSDSMLAVLEDLVMVETPSSDTGLLERGMGFASTAMHRLLGEVPETLHVDGRPVLRLHGGGDRPVLVLGHIDTVWPRGTTRRWPFRVAGGRATGPGVFDMKAGLVQALYAVSLLRDQRDVTVLVTSDEEIGSASSRALLEDEARRSRAVLIPEPSAAGALKTARKGVSMYRVRVEGRAAHAGLEPEQGVNATVELAHQVVEIAALADGHGETTVTPTTSRAGTSRNTVPALGEVDIDARAWTVDEQERLHDALQSLSPHDDRARVLVSGGVNRPPLEGTATAALMLLARRCAVDLGLPPLQEAAVGGGSDGNFTGALGVPTLDGLGAVGGNAHAEGEWADVAAMPERAGLLHLLLQRIPDAYPKPGAAPLPGSAT